ncbi:tryptophan synthase subunit alpha [Actinosynnema sp. NPDC023794]
MPEHPAARTGRFFDRVPAGDIGLAVFLNAGDPPLPVLRELLPALDEAGVDCLELAVPFPDSPTDGPAVQRSARRALDRGVGLTEVLDLLAEVRGGLRRTRIALLADWAHTVRPTPIASFVATVADSAADGLLVHALPPRLRADYLDAAATHHLPVVATCYAQSSPTTRADARLHASAYLYLVAHRGRSGLRPADGFTALAPTIHELRGAAPVAVGFGVRTAADLWSLAAAGADAAVVGSAAVDRVEHCRATGGDVVAELTDWVAALRPSTVPTGGPTAAS